MLPIFILVYNQIDWYYNKIFVVDNLQLLSYLVNTFLLLLM